MSRIIAFIVDQLSAFASNVSDLIEMVIDLPRAVLGARSDESLLVRSVLILFQVVWFPITAIGWLVLAPLRLFTDFTDQRRDDFMYGLPALLVLGFVVVIAVMVNLQGEEIAKRYRSKGQAFMLAGDFEKAKTYLGRVITSEGDRAENADVFNWAQVLSETGEPNRAAAIMDRLAPFEKVGYAKAHQLKAVALTRTLRMNRDPEVLKKLRWHLEQSRESSLAINQAWAVYYLAVEQPAKAVGYLEEASKLNPNNLIDLAQVHKQLGNQSAANQAIEEAETRFRELVNRDPLVTQNRILLANALVRLEKIEDAEVVLLAGDRIQSDPLVKRALADFYIMRHDRSKKGKDSFAEQMEYLRKSMTYDMNYPPVYQRLVDLYKIDRSEQESETIKKAIMESLAGDHPSALSHFALSNVLLMEDQAEKAEWHLEQAYNLEPNFIYVLNNLAWTLAHKEEPDLDRALELSRKLLEKAPDDARFIDTYAKVLMKQGKDREAVVEFERALVTIKNKKPLHQNLAILYRRLGNEELAKLHQEKADKQ